MGTEGLKVGQVKKWVTRILSKKKKKLIGKDQEARPLEPGGGAELEGEGTALSVAGAQRESRGGVVSCRGVCTQSGS